MSKRNDLIQRAAAQMAATYAGAEIPMYGASLRLPERQAVLEILDELQKLMFPAYFGDKHLTRLPPERYSALLLELIGEKLERQIALALPEAQSGRAAEICDRFVARLPELQRILMTDLSANFDGDPAAQSKEEVVFSYPGFYTIFVYRIAHELYCEQVPMIPRMMTEHAHSQTGIDINPGATIGEYFFIDHGTGIVVGETCIIGKHVKMYQGSTLGALSTRQGHNGPSGRRHPKVGDNVTIYANATVLGGKTDIGENCVVGGNAFVTRSVAENTTVSIEAPALRFRDQREKAGCTAQDFDVK